MNNQQKILVLSKLQSVMAEQLAMYGHPSQTKQRIQVLTSFKKTIDAVKAA